MYQSVGFDTSPNDHPTKLIRNTVLTWACNFNEAQCLDSSSEFFTKWMDDPNGPNE
jgi:hypothetical protein